MRSVFRPHVHITSRTYQVHVCSTMIFFAHYVKRAVFSIVVTIICPRCFDFFCPCSQQATFDISIFEHGSEAFGSKLQIFQVSFVPQFPKETQIPRKQHQIQRFDLKASEPCQNIEISNVAYSKLQQKKCINLTPNVVCNNVAIPDTKNIVLRISLMTSLLP